MDLLGLQLGVDAVLDRLALTERHVAIRTYLHADCRDLIVDSRRHVDNRAQVYPRQQDDAPVLYVLSDVHHFGIGHCALRIRVDGPAISLHLGVEQRVSFLSADWRDIYDGRSRTDLHDHQHKTMLQGHEAVAAARHVPTICHRDHQQVK